MASAATEIRVPAADMIEVLLTLSPSQYAEMGHDLEALRRKHHLPKSASNTHVILEAVRRQASGG